ncbi:MAG: zinc-binding dehydrogenase [Actinobacteria bacterium]|nr:MAG: zinc-binding dehydrogenase [Actinomycetota bacterium]
MRAVVFTGAGGNEVVRFEERPDPVPEGDEVLLAVRYSGLNPADLAQRAGNYPAPPGSPADIPGIETSGTVLACGPTSKRFEVGARVFGIVGGGGHADRVVVHERHVAPVPDSLDDLAAAAVPEAFVTAHDAVMTQAGSRVLATLRAAVLREPVAALGADVIAPDELVDAARARGGADVVLELVGAPNVEHDLDALALKGRVIVVGTGAGDSAQIALRKLMGRRARLIGTGLRVRPLEEKAAAVQAFAREVVPHLANGRIAPLVDRVFPAEEATAAFDRLAEPGKLGKVLLDFGA